MEYKLTDIQEQNKQNVLDVIRNQNKINENEQKKKAVLDVIKQQQEKENFEKNFDFVTSEQIEQQRINKPQLDDADYQFENLFKSQENRLDNEIVQKQEDLSNNYVMVDNNLNTPTLGPNCDISRFTNGAILKVTIHSSQNKIYKKIELLINEKYTDQFNFWPLKQLISMDDDENNENDNCLSQKNTFNDSDNKQKYSYLKIDEHELSNEYDLDKYKNVLSKLGEINIFIVRHFKGTHNIASKKEKIRNPKKDTDIIGNDFDIPPDNISKDFEKTSYILKEKLKELGNTDIDYVFLSDLRRTQQTYEQIKKRSMNEINYPDRNDTIILPEIHEIDYKNKLTGICNESMAPENKSLIYKYFNSNSLENNYNTSFYKSFVNNENNTKKTKRRIKFQDNKNSENNYYNRKNRPKSRVSKKMFSDGMTSNIDFQVIKILDIILKNKNINKNNSNILVVSHNSRIRCYLKELFLYSMTSENINKLNDKKKTLDNNIYQEKLIKSQQNKDLLRQKRQQQFRNLSEKKENFKKTIRNQNQNVRRNVQNTKRNLSNIQDKRRINREDRQTEKSDKINNIKKLIKNRCESSEILNRLTREKKQSNDKILEYEAEIFHIENNEGINQSNKNTIKNFRRKIKLEKDKINLKNHTINAMSLTISNIDNTLCNL